MSLSLTSTPPSVMRIAAPLNVQDACAAVLLLGVQLRSAHEFGDVATLRQRTDELIDQATQQLRAGGLSDAEVADAVFALVAFVDESIIRSEWAERAEWLANPLQFRRFQRYDAGEEFFVRLKRLQDERPVRMPVLQVYYHCLTLGFKGKYPVATEASWVELVRGVGAQLTNAVGPPPALSPHGVADVVLANAVKRIPAWVVAAAGGVIAILIYFVLVVLISWRAGGVEDLLRPR